VQRVALIVVVTICLLASAGYFYWISSPFFAFQQVALAVKDHDQAQFDRYVDFDNLIDQLLDDVLVQPAAATPHLSGFQREVAGGALGMAKANIIKGMTESLHKALSRESLNQSTGPDTSFWQNFAGDAAIASPIYRGPLLAQATDQNPAGTPGMKDLFNSAGHELSGEISRLKNTAYNRMFAYIQSHPDTVPGKLINCPPEERSSHARALLEQYGLTAKHFKGLGECKSVTDMLGREKSDIGLRFYSPKIDSEVTVIVAMEKGLTSKDWRIMRLSNIKDVMNEVEVNYDRDIHELVEYSLSGMSNENLHADWKNMKSKIIEHPAAQNLLKRLQMFR